MGDKAQTTPTEVAQMSPAESGIALVLCAFMTVTAWVAVLGIAERRRHIERLHEQRDARADVPHKLEPGDEFPRVLGRMGPGGYVERRQEPREYEYEDVRDDWATREARRRVAAATDEEVRQMLRERLGV